MSILDKFLGKAQNASGKAQKVAGRGGTYGRSTTRRPAGGTSRGTGFGRGVGMASW